MNNITLRLTSLTYSTTILLPNSTKADFVENTDIDITRCVCETLQKVMHISTMATFSGYSTFVRPSVRRYLFTFSTSSQEPHDGF